MARTRRALLAALTATAAGCSSARVGSPPTSEPSDDVTPTAPRTDSPTDRQEPTRVALDDDRVRWRVDLPGARSTDPTTAGGQLFVATGSRLSGTATDEESGAGYLTAISLSDGGIDWHRSLPDPPSDGGAVHDDALYLPIGQSTGLHGVGQRLLSVDTDGTQRWQSAERDKFLRIYDFEDSRVFLGTADDHLQREGETTYSVDLDTGTEHWAVESGDAAGGRVTGETLYADYGGLAIASLATADGSTRWQHGAEPLHGNDRALPEAGGHLFTAIEREDSYGIAGIDATEGTTSWTHGLDADEPFVATSATAVGETVVATEFDGLLFARDGGTGEARWRQRFDERVRPPIHRDGVLYCSVLDGPVVAVDADSGDERWRAAGGDGYSRVEPTDGALLVGSQSDGETTVEARRVSDGSRQWRRRLPGAGVAFERTGDTLAVLTDDRSVYGIALD